MDGNGDLRTRPIEPSGSTGPAIAALTADLEDLVDQLEADWLDHRILRQETVVHLHELRARAERLVETMR